MFEMFVSQGRSGSHLLKKPGRGLPDWLIGEWQRMLHRSPLWHLQWMDSAEQPQLVVSLECPLVWQLMGWVLLEQLVQRLGLLSLVSLGTTQVRTLV